MERFDPYDYDEGRDEPEAFFTYAEPCESCGAPVEDRKPAPWQSDLMVGPCCYNEVQEGDVPEVPECSALYELTISAETVGQMMDLRAAHRATCATCGGLRKSAGSEGQKRKERAA